MDINDVPPFPNPGVRLIKEDEQVAIWEEVFEPGKPTTPHRHMRDYIAFFPNEGQLTIIPVAGGEEEFTIAAGQVQHSQTGTGAVRLNFSDGAVFYQRIPVGGSCHYAVNEGSEPAKMVLIEIKGAGTEERAK